MRASTGWKRRYGSLSGRGLYSRGERTSSISIVLIMLMLPEPFDDTDALEPVLAVECREVIEAVVLRVPEVAFELSRPESPFLDPFVEDNAEDDDNEVDERGVLSLLFPGSGVLPVSC